MYHVFDLLGRLMMSAIFFYEAIDSLMYTEQTKTTMADYGIFWSQDLLLYGSILMLFIGALMLLIGYRVKFGVWLLLIYWLPVTFIVYSFWNDPVELQRMNAIFFMRNIAVAGGLLIVASHGAGKFSVRRLMRVSKLPPRENF